MDVWVEFKNASRWQAEHLFRNFFPFSDADLPSNNPSTVNLESEANKLELEGLELPNAPASPASSTFSSLFSDAFSGISSLSGSGSPSIPSSSPSSSPSRAGRSRCASTATQPKTNEKAEGHIPPAMEEHIAACSHSAPPLSGARLAELAKQFANALPDEEFSVAALQGCECSFSFVLGDCFFVPFIAGGGCKVAGQASCGAGAVDIRGSDWVVVCSVVHGVNALYIYADL